ncbi:hypothetical protein IMG5_008600 [Ichthyophthirius multifiliis]|uniref:Uncharacterized protein n=1 Tax=Ichthyophthirius multifiliis TaxID=5932 RepID=G0QJS7_ICHMU|nr:hypothetical protein IMG5_008600 [Ichthyophthirius multifiliis]EGR34528.1 hypothetical protein IMG5_008600 [Ichthyophthirius multifiliis]|eukprot:XP_004039832.1 hypothetical protein IMG5_008600 [Ichthyophthirius multifiliis]
MNNFDMQKTQQKNMRQIYSSLQNYQMIKKKNILKIKKNNMNYFCKNQKRIKWNYFQKEKKFKYVKFLIKIQNKKNKNLSHIQNLKNLKMQYKLWKKMIKGLF